MAIHYSVSSMVQESLVEKLISAKQAIEYRKDPSQWGSSGCLGHPALTLLMSIADTIGSYVINGSVRQHFNILRHPDYYNLNLTDANIDTIYRHYRNLQTHNSTIAVGVVLDIGSPNNSPFEVVNNLPTIFLIPLFNTTVSALARFLPNANNIILSSRQLQTILNT